MSFGNILDVGTLQAQFTINTAPATAAINTVIAQTQQITQTFNQTYQMKVDTNAAVTNINKVTAALGGMKQVLEAIGVFAGFELLTKAVGSLGDNIIGMNAKLEQSQLAFTAITGSAQTATTLVQQLETLAAHSTFGLAQLQQAAQQMLAFGVAAQNVPPLLQAVQNAAAASGRPPAEALQRITLALDEMLSMGKVSERQLRQLAQAGVPLNAIAQELGVTTAQLQEAGKTNSISAEEIVAAFAKIYTQGNLGDFMQRQAGTFNGAMSLIRTNLSLAIAQGFQPLFQWISNVAVKIGEFVQTPTFQQWVAQLRAAVSAAIDLFKTLLSVLAPVGDAFAKFFGLDTANISAEMEAVKNIKVDVGQYDSALQNAAGSAKENAAQLKDLKGTIDDASLAISDLNGKLLTNKEALDANAASIKAVKDQYDPVIQNAEAQIRAINVLSPDELSRKDRELQLDKQRADLEASKPDTSAFDTAIASDQQTLANLPRLDTSGFDNQLRAVQDKIAAAQAQDPAAGLRAQIQSIQDAISGLNTDALDEKINALRDTLSQPAPDVSGLTNTLAELSAQIEMAVPGANVDALRQQYASVSAQKSTILRSYETSQTGAKSELTVAEQQRRDQALANAETKKADEEHIRDLQEQVKTVEAQHAAQIKGYEAERTQIERNKADATAADQQRRQALDDDIKKNEAARTAALADYTSQTKAIEAEQTRLRNLDAASAAQRAINLEPWKRALDEAKTKEDALLEPLNKEKESLDAIRTKLSEQKAEQEQAKSAAEAQARALKDGATNADQLAANLAKIPTSGPAGPALWYGPGTYNSTGGSGGLDPNAPVLRFFALLKNAVEELRAPIAAFVDVIGTIATWIRTTGIPALQDFIAWLTPHLKDSFDGARLAGEDFTQWELNHFGPVTRDAITVGNDLVQVFVNLEPPIAKLTAVTLPGFQALLALAGEAAKATTLAAAGLADELTTLTNDAIAKLHEALVSLHLLLSGEVFKALGTFTSTLTVDVAKATNGFITSLGENGVLGALNKVKEWIGSEWGTIGDQLAAPFTTAWQSISGFFGNLWSGIQWLGNHFHLPVGSPPSFAGVATSAGGASDTGATSGTIGGVQGHAAGLLDSPTGHFAMVGERGPELMFVPKHAAIIPNHLLPGHADGFNLGALDTAIQSVGGAVRGVGVRLVDTLMNNLGTPDADNVLPGLGQAIAQQVKDGLMAWLRPAGRAGRATEGGALGPLVGLIEDAAARYGVPADIVGAIILHESGGIIGRTEIGGGLGRGLMQVDGGTWPQAYDPRMSGTSIDDAAYQIDVGTMILSRGWNPGDIVQSLRNYSGAGFDSVHGRSFYQELVDMGLITQADAALAAPAVGAASGAFGAVSGNGWPDVLQAAIGMQDDPTVNGAQWNLLCEKFAEMAERAAGYSEGYWPTALAHAEGVPHNDGWGPPGSMQHWGDGYYPLGHAAINLDGAGTVIGTSPSGIATYSMSGADDNRGWIPPGLAQGGAFSTPTIVTVGDGGQREFVLPESDLRRIVRSESGGTPVSINFEPGSIVGSPGMDVRELASQIVDEINARAHGDLISHALRAA